MEINLNGESISVNQVTTLERKPKHQYRQTMKDIKNLVEATNRLYNQLDSQEQLIRKRISRNQEWIKYWIKTGTLTNKEKSLVYYTGDLLQRLTNISYMKDLEHKERLQYYLKVEISLEALQTKKPLRKNLRSLLAKGYN